MNLSHRHRRPRKVRRTGRHTRPSQVHNVAETAYKAAPAMAIAGVLIAAPQAHAGAKLSVGTTTVIEQVHGANKVPDRGTAGPTALAGQIHTDALVIHHETARAYTVRPGDTLSSIAQRFYETRPTGEGCTRRTGPRYATRT